MENTQTQTPSESINEGMNVAPEALEQLSLSEINELAGREFKDKADFMKHYSNLKSFVGAKIEPNTEELDKARQQAEEVKKELAGVKSWLSDAGIEMEKTNPFELSKLAKSIQSKTDVAPKGSAPFGSKTEKVKELGEKVLRHGRSEDKEALVAEALGMKNQFQGDSNALGRIRGY